MVGAGALHDSSKPLHESRQEALLLLLAVPRGPRAALDPSGRCAAESSPAPSWECWADFSVHAQPGVGQLGSKHSSGQFHPSCRRTHQCPWEMAS